MSEYKITMPEGWKPRAHNKCDFCKKDLVCHKHFGICPLSRAVPAKEVEPLAVLADRKGFYEVRIQGPTKTVNAWDIELCSELEDEEGSQREKTFDDPIYASAESAARAYLESLPDVEKGGR